MIASVRSGKIVIYLILKYYWYIMLRLPPGKRRYIAQNLLSADGIEGLAEAKI